MEFFCLKKYPDHILKYAEYELTGQLRIQGIKRTSMPFSFRNTIRWMPYY